ncbi:hypothetical protein [Jutongia sp.]|jgi:hypothetical protein|uniref:hypothetical protein n=1 Tax=Jutongia sp. TaxID=2944204 RepID=UPI00095FBAFB|nr:hypothetical protein [Clostridium sp.]OKZ83935.1 MAG: hypothetical protein BHW06_04245 [Clostridium sp. 44_14]RHU93787.1 hypothetical protein DXC08_10710 [Clostridium sp. OM07-9AC]RHV03859.1 hypothetical protein DXB96_08980 [Clostridium sp. OM07-10AC]
MGSSIDYKLDKIVDYLYRKRNKIARDITVDARRRAFQFELTLSKSDYTTITINSNRTYILTMPRSSMLPEDENMSYLKDMPFSEKMALVDAWGELKMRLNNTIARDGNLGLTFDETKPPKDSSSGEKTE